MLHYHHREAKHAREAEMRYGAKTLVAEDPVRIPVRDTALNADLGMPEQAHGLVIFAHGSGSGRKSPRNRAVAATLWNAGLATLLLDLLTEQEERIDAVTGEHRFDILLLSRRLAVAIDWAKQQSRTVRLPIGLFGASTGAAAALMAAAARPNDVKAVVSRGGRPDLAGSSLPAVRAPTLLIVGGYDFEVIELNRQAFRLLSSTKDIEIVPGATHLFEEAGALEKVAELASAWFGRHLAVETAPT